MCKWQEMFPEGRVLFYEGDDPEGFVKEMKEKFNFDPSMTGVDFATLSPIPNTPNKAWGEWIEGSWEFVHTNDPREMGKKQWIEGYFAYAFHCPGHLMDKVYGGPYPLGS